MAPLFLDPGLLRKRALLQRKLIGSDGMGGAEESWSEVAELSVHVEPVTMAPGERLDQHEAILTHRVICRARGDIERGMAFAVGSRRLTILSVHDPDESGRYLVCRCTEET
ncbi:phage head closure protein [Consotaella salsifontis]|uniref:Phage head-tail adaptor, putative, SPP1 family n=1 Tax=Consotaella salsifontis TaxID=1365950 RepID=A0A1T4MEW6_9HYPH|nr:phage head closure protein [Consotaella salsifontis]SJZ65304.1 phage head-tail adaptor, putative, SPP1 family [Consotaella salsifontis]